MRIVIQRVKRASVSIEGRVESAIEKGMMLLLGVGYDDTDADIDWLVKKTVNLRIFDDSEGVMNLSVKDVAGSILVVSQFTLMASCKKGNRPSYIHAASPDVSVPLSERFCKRLSEALEKPVATGVFGADMQVELVNDGPVTIVIDSKDK